jgi:hypothetical protein
MRKDNTNQDKFKKNDHHLFVNLKIWQSWWHFFSLDSSECKQLSTYKSMLLIFKRRIPIFIDSVYYLEPQLVYLHQI